MDELEDDRTVQVNGTNMDETITMVVDDNAGLNEEPLHTESSQVVTVIGSIGSEAVLDEMKTGEQSEVKGMEEGLTSEEQQGINKLNATETMEQAVAKVEAEDDLDRNEINEAGIEEEKPVQMMGEEAVEEQVVEDRTEDQVPDITGTDNADVMATSMDSIEELPTSEEQVVEISALAEQEVKPSIESETSSMVLAPSTEAEALSEEERSAIDPEFEARQEVNETEAVQEKEEALAEESLATNESEAVVDEMSGAGAEETKKEDLDNERNESDNIELLNEEQQSKVSDNEAEGNSFASALPPEEKSETIHSSRTSSLKFEEANDGPMVTPLIANQEFNFDEEKPFSKKSITEDKVLSRKSTIEGKSPSRKTSAMGEELPSRKVSTVEGKVLSRETSVTEDEKPQSRKTSEVKEKKVSSRKSSTVQEAKTLSRKTSETEEKVSSRKTSAVEEEKVASRKSSATQERVPTRKISLEMEEKAPSRKTSKMTSVEEENSEVKELSPEPAGAPQSVRAEKTKIANTEVTESKVESKLEPIAEPGPGTKKAVIEVGEAETIAEVPTEGLNDEVPFEDATAEDVKDDVKRVSEAEKENEAAKYNAVDERESPPPTRQIISSPPRMRSPSPSRKRQERSPSPVTREASRGSTCRSYDQDTHRQRGPPPRMPSYLSFSSYTPVEKAAYSPISPWVQNAAQKYRNDYTAVSTYKLPSMYTSIFDDIVSSGPFSSSLYSANRLLERSRSRSRELRNALRSKRSTSNYYRYTSNYATPPLRTRDYSTPPLSSVGRSSSRSGSFISFMEYNRQKQYELARSSSRLSTLGGLSRASSRSNVDMFYDTERLSRVDSYVRDLNRNVEYVFPSTYDKYRSPSRAYLPQEYTPVNGYRAYNSPLRHSVLYTNPYIYNPISVSHNLYENRIAELQRSLSRERLARERMKAKYKTLSDKLDQACRQMDLLRTSSSSSIRGGMGTYSVYTHNYPYF
uniref:Microtubule-associated protein futsch n=1 Tax=Loa loa TaxID=7209 RepID=A0A1I7VZ24_LOALO